MVMFESIDYFEEICAGMITEEEIKIVECK